jgi:ribosomal protein L7/L12
MDELNADSGNGNDQKEIHDEASEKKIAEYEEIMRLIKEVTGVSDISEIVAKFQSQRETHSQLNQLQMNNEVKIQELKEKKKKVMLESDEFKFNGDAKSVNSRRTIEEFENHLNVAKSEFQEAKLKYERSVKILTSANAGIQHLTEKLEAIKAVII